MIGYFKASNTGANDQFGYAVALSADGNTLAVGAPYEDSEATGIGGDQTNDLSDSSGAVYIFARSNGAWAQQAYVKASNSRSSFSFGSALALSSDGNTLAVGAPGEDSNAKGVDGDQDNSFSLDAGAVYVFSRSGGTWTQQAYVKSSNTELSASDVGDGFGIAVALSSDGNTLAVGAVGEDSAATGINGNQNNNNADDAGAVYVFGRTDTVWSQQAYIKASNTAASSLFGYAITLTGDGDMLAVGAPGEASNATGIGGNQSDTSAFGAGAVYLFARIEGVWSQQAYVKASNTGAGDNFGVTLALATDGNTLAVGAPQEDGNSQGINGNEADNSGFDTGAVYLFKRTSGIWAQQAYMKASNAADSDQFGGNVALSADGDMLAVGALGEDSVAAGVNGRQNDETSNASGAVYGFKRSGGTWSQQAYMKASNTGVSDFFGIELTLSADGETLAIGATFEDSIATGLGGNQNDGSADGAGAVYLY
jgi:hypothetical protein